MDENYIIEDFTNDEDLVFNKKIMNVFNHTALWIKIIAVFGYLWSIVVFFIFTTKFDNMSLVLM